MNNEYSDRHIGETDDPPLLNGTCYESEDGEIVQFLVTVRNNKSGELFGKTPVGIIRAAIIEAATEHGISCAHSGRPDYARASGDKRG